MERPTSKQGFDLTSLPWLRRVLVSRWPQWIVTALALAFFVYAIVAGIIGTPVGNRNLAITLVWIAWWALLTLVLLPVGGRLWCSICPIPVPGEWLQRRGLMIAGGRSPFGIGRRWPRRLRSLWLQNAAFLLLALFSAVILTQPSVTAALLLGMLVLAVVIGVVFERRTFCRYLCPLGGFIGLFSLPAPLALRVRDRQVCKTHATKECFHGNSQGHGCPWITYAGALENNQECGLCLECLRSCSLGNVELRLQRPGNDLAPGRVRLKVDGAYKGFIMVGAALVYSAVMMGPWGVLKDAASTIGSAAWVVYALAILAVMLIILPGAYWLAARLGGRVAWREGVASRALFLKAATGLVPLGLAAWAAFSVSFLLVNGSYVLSSLSDPLGWDWNLFGMAGLAWQPVLSDWVPKLQAVILLAGLAGAAVVSLRMVQGEGSAPRRSLLAVAPTLLVHLGVVAGMLWLYL